MKKILLVLGLFLLPQWALAQTPVITKPYLAASNNGSGTITTTNAFQSVFAASARPQAQGGTGPVRSACTVQNKGTNAMSVYFGPIANADAAHSSQLVAGQSLNCNVGGVVLSDQISITGTSGDAFYATQQ